jgi:hypothetical protein
MVVRMRVFSTTARICIIALLLSLTACQLPAARDDPDSRFYRIHSGSRLVLHTDLQIPPQRARVYFQHGRQVGGLDNYAVGCEFEVRELGPGVVRPEAFMVKRAESSREWISQPNILRFYRTIYLQSELQPGVLKLVCQVWDDPLWPSEITIRQVREALGGYFTLELLTGL